MPASPNKGICLRLFGTLPHCPSSLTTLKFSYPYSNSGSLAPLLISSRSVSLIRKMELALHWLIVNTSCFLFVDVSFLKSFLSAFLKCSYPEAVP